MEIQRTASVKGFILFRKSIEPEMSRYNMTAFEWPVIEPFLFIMGDSTIRRFRSFLPEVPTFAQLHERPEIVKWATKNGANLNGRTRIPARASQFLHSSSI
jgi:hypothetical protein